MTVTQIPARWEPAAGMPVLHVYAEEAPEVLNGAPIPDPRWTRVVHAAGATLALALVGTAAAAWYGPRVVYVAALAVDLLLITAVVLGMVREAELGGTTGNPADLQEQG